MAAWCVPGTRLPADHRPLHGGGTQEAQEAGRLMSNISVAEEAAPTDGSSLFKIELRCDIMDHSLAPQAWVASHRKRES
jgi:hypothetical protein